MLNFTVATSQDAALLSQLGEESYRHHFSAYWQEPAELEAFIHREYARPVITQSLAGGDCWLIAAADRPVGFIKLSWSQSLPDSSASGAYLHKLYLLAQQTGQGWGQQMFAEACRQARERQECWLWLEVLANNTGARRFYQRQGMHEVGSCWFGSDSQRSELIQMQMAL
ncbi:hypothetical protein BTJ39_01695 [Izhakiella australiensis]|uniref:N-acetyltransferase domain-containing protein n=1 Tax=Izhakiella australiensis TaxID=1926881 RepID=A0A1S8YSR8_9GAMM|nr:GNAT family N-acetyltransferase [Izhakiella australiensis]OON41898.1 hypothetical protein BTJ39_01695 [Izhakiella australiensis]